MVDAEAALEMTLDDVIQVRSHGGGSRGRGRGRDAGVGRGRKGSMPAGAMAGLSDSNVAKHTDTASKVTAPDPAPAGDSGAKLDMSLDEVIEKSQQGNKSGKGQKKGSKGGNRPSAHAVVLGSAEKKNESTQGAGSRKIKGQGRGNGSLGLRGKTLSRWALHGRGSLIKNRGKEQSSWNQKTNERSKGKGSAGQAQSERSSASWNEKHNGKSWDQHSVQSNSWWQQKTHIKDNSAWSQGNSGVSRQTREGQDQRKDANGQWGSSWGSKQFNNSKDSWGRAEADANSWKKKNNGAWNQEQSDKDWWKSSRKTTSWTDRGSTGHREEWALHGKADADARSTAHKKQDSGSWTDKSRDGRQRSGQGKGWGEDSRSDRRSTDKMNAWSQDPKKDDGRDRNARNANGDSRGRKRLHCESSAETSVRGKKIKVTNVPHDLDRVDIKEAFEAEAGKILRCELDRGTAWISFHRQEDAQQAVDTFDRGELNGNTISVQFDRS